MRIAIAIFVGFAVSGCVMTPDEPNFVREVTGNYQAIADCAYLDLSSRSIAWRKSDLDSINTSRLTLGNDDMQQGIIDFIGTSPDRTAVKARMQPTIQSGVWDRRLNETLDQCI